MSRQASAGRRCEQSICFVAQARGPGRGRANYDKFAVFPDICGNNAVSVGFRQGVRENICKLTHTPRAADEIT